ncbi:MAG: DUF5916 domain-containing protein, partial [Bacteroidota bacterium]
MPRIVLLGLAVLAGLAAAAHPARAQAPTFAPDPTERQATAVFVDEAPRIDGRLDEAIWREIKPLTVFTQVWPETGAAGTEDTEVHIAYDRDNLYFAFRNRDRTPELIRARNLERGGRNSLDDHVFIGLDTYRDGRNAYLFEMNALGTQDDALITDEDIGFESFSWDAIFYSETVIDDTGWTMEVAIPFNQLRFPEGEDLSFGLMISRSISRKNERMIWPAIGLERGSPFMALATVSQYGVLNGLRGIRRGRNLEIKPYVISGGQQARPDLAAPPEDAEFTYDAGVDIKYGITSSLTLDATVNTDFAQVEADDVQINLSRFSLFFPEKREFFLERAGLFEHGSSRAAQTFFSRRIGLDESILAGARMTGQIGPFSVGLLNIETGPELSDFLGPASTNNAVARLRADVLPRTTIGGIVTRFDNDVRQNTAAGIDGEVRFGQNSVVRGWITQVWDSEPGQSSAAGATFAQLANERFGTSIAFRSVGRTYDPALGFVRRRDYRRLGSSTFIRQPVDNAPLGIRLLYSDFDVSGFWGLDGTLQSSEIELEALAETANETGVGAGIRRVFERLDAPFTLRDGETVPVGEYGFTEAFLYGSTDGNRPFSVEAGVQIGGFFSGNRTELGFETDWRPSPGLTLSTDLEHSIIDLGNGPFTATLGSVSIATAFSRTLFGRTLLQYDNFSKQVRANIRFNWIHTPGSDLFLVFNTAYNVGEDDPLDPRQNIVFRDRVAVV